MTDLSKPVSPPACACKEVHGFDCQFPDAPAEHSLDGYYWCMFHLPLKDVGGNPSGKYWWIKGVPALEAFEQKIFGTLRDAKNNNGQAQFSYIVFPKSFDFSGDHNIKPLCGNFSNACFGENMNFAGVTFGDSVSFYNAIFLDRAIFTGATFLRDPNFTCAKFLGYTNFETVRFCYGIKFDRVTFKSEVDFTRTTFENGANFYNAKFKHEVDFTATNFAESATFSKATFESRALFIDAAFGRHASFECATFKRATFFDRARFGDGLRFTWTIFAGTAIFDGAIFGNDAHFVNAAFHENIFFAAPNAKDSKYDFQRIFFSNANFNGQVSFENRQFEATSSFDGAIFEDLPYFHGCKLHQGTSFHGTKFQKTKGESDNATSALEQAYRTLKLGMETLRARNEEAMFFALEMECRRNRSDVPPFERFAAMLYKHLSDYGQSILRPLSWLGGVTVIMGSIYFYLLWAMFSSTPTDIWGGAPKVQSVVAFTVEQMFRPFYVWSKDSSGIRLNLFGNDDLLIPLLASLQSLAAIALLALFLLALRRRFKMD